MGLGRLVLRKMFFCWIVGISKTWNVWNICYPSVSWISHKYTYIYIYIAIFFGISHKFLGTPDFSGFPDDAAGIPFAKGNHTTCGQFFRSNGFNMFQIRAMSRKCQYKMLMMLLVDRVYKCFYCLCFNFVSNQGYTTSGMISHDFHVYWGQPTPPFRVSLYRVKTYFLRVVPTLRHYSDTVSDTAFGRTYGRFMHN